MPAQICFSIVGGILAGVATAGIIGGYRQDTKTAAAAGKRRDPSSLLRLSSIGMLLPAIGFFIGLIISDGISQSRLDVVLVGESTFNGLSIVGVIACVIQTIIGIFVCRKIDNEPDPFVFMI